MTSSFKDQEKLLVSLVFGLNRVLSKKIKVAHFYLVYTYTS